MKTLLGRRALWVGMAIVLLLGIVLIARQVTSINFVDNPALLLEVSDAGKVTLDTHQGTICAPLADVHWKSDPAFLAEAQRVINVAQRDMVAYAESKDGGLRIWYQTDSGPESLNRRINAVAAEVSATKLR